MTYSTALLTGSLALNAGLLAAFAFKPALAPPALRDYFERAPSAEALAAEAATRERAAAREARRAEIQDARVRARLWAALDSEDLPTLIGRLRAAGFTSSLVSAIVRAKVEERFAGRWSALARQIEETPYWKPGPMDGMGGRVFFEEWNQISRERSRLMRELLGQEGLASAGSDPTAAQQRQYGNLSPAKIDLLQRINDDYAEMTSQVRAATMGITLPEDREKLALLEREKRADLAAFLTPQELADYEMRSSQITARLRTPLTIMDASEDEFRTIFQVQQQFADALYLTMDNYTGPTSFSQRREAQQQVANQLKAALGEQRYAEFARATNSEFQGLYRLAQRENVPMTAAAQAYDLRNSVAEQSQQIYADRNLTTAQKRAALQTLANSTKAQIVGALGPTVGESYVRTARWLTSVENGGSVTLGPDGNITSTRSLPRN